MHASTPRILARARRLAHTPATRLAWFSLAALWLAWPLFATAGSLNEFRDAQVLFNYEDVAVRSVRRFFEWPLWNPYYCGGLYGLGTPQSRFASPPFLLSLLFGTLRAQPVIAWAMSVLGMEGMYRFARARCGSALGPALVAPLIAGNGFFAFSYCSGWLNFYGFLLLPWVLYGADRTLRGARSGPLVVALAFTFIVGFGGTYAGPLAALVTIAQVARGFFGRRARLSRPAVYGRLALAAYLALALSTFRLWPVIESLIEAPRFMAGRPGEPLAAFGQRLFRIAHAQGGEYTRSGQNFIGLWVLPLVALGLMRRRAVAPLVLGLLCTWVATGYAYPASLFAALRALPVLEMLRYPERFLFLSALFVYELAALGIDRWVSRSRARPRLALVLLALGVISLLSLRETARDVRAGIQGMWLGPAPLEIERPFAQARGNRWLAAHYPAISRGSIACWEAYPVPMSPRLRGDLPAEEYLADPLAGAVRRRAWSPNEITLDVSLTRPTTLLVNQNHHRGWRSSVGSVRALDGLLAVDLPAGEHALVLAFAPRSARYGALVSLLALASAIGFAYGSRRIALAGAAGAPLVLAASFALSDEPLPVRPAPQNADGTLFFADALPPEARPLDVDFALPIRLEGAALSAQDGDGIAHAQLFWRVVGALPDSVGVSVHFESDRGRRVHADHDILGANATPSRAPREVLIRDSVATVVDSAPDEHWKVYVSLWHVHGDGSRVPVRDAGGAAIDQDRVLVGAF